MKGGCYLVCHPYGYMDNTHCVARFSSVQTVRVRHVVRSPFSLLTYPSLIEESKLLLRGCMVIESRNTSSKKKCQQACHKFFLCRCDFLEDVFYT